MIIFQTSTIFAGIGAIMALPNIFDDTAHKFLHFFARRNLVLAGILFTAFH